MKVVNTGNICRNRRVACPALARHPSVQRSNEQNRARSKLCDGIDIDDAPKLLKICFVRLCLQALSIRTDMQGLQRPHQGKDTAQQAAKNGNVKFRENCPGDQGCEQLLTGTCNLVNG